MENDEGYEDDAQLDETVDADVVPLGGDTLPGTEGVKVSVVGINGDWLPDQPRLGEKVRLEVAATVVEAGKKLRDGERDGPTQDFVKLAVHGVTVID